MSLNNIELPGFIIADFYQKTLIAGLEKAGQHVAESSVGYKFLGKNQQKTVIVVHSETAVFLPEHNLAFLSKMLEACKLNMGDVALVNHASSPVEMNTLKKQLNPRILILFGVAPTDIKLPIEFPRFKTQSYDGCTFIAAPALEELDQDTEESKVMKGKLWACFKQVFEL